MASMQNRDLQNEATPLRPAQFAMHYLISGIIEGVYAPGTRLPNERDLAQQLGVTRPTLRETLQRLAQEGWITIAHGKPTRVNNYWRIGGLGLLSTLAEHIDHFPRGLVYHLLTVRSQVMPAIARLAVERAPGVLSAYLDRADAIPDDPAEFCAFDWNLHLLMARHCGNPVYNLLLNDFTPMYRKLASIYFQTSAARKASQRYYRQLRGAIRNQTDSVTDIVQAAMIKSIELWGAIENEETAQAV